MIYSINWEAIAHYQWAMWGVGTNYPCAPRVWRPCVLWGPTADYPWVWGADYRRFCGSGLPIIPDCVVLGCRLCLRQGCQFSLIASLWGADYPCFRRFRVPIITAFVGKGCRLSLISAFWGGDYHWVRAADYPPARRADYPRVCPSGLPIIAMHTASLPQRWPHNVASAPWGAH